MEKNIFDQTVKNNLKTYDSINLSKQQVKISVIQNEYNKLIPVGKFKKKRNQNATMFFYY